MISFLGRKMWKNKWMVVCLFIGNLLFVGIVAATPLYSNATMRRVLHQDLRTAQLENNQLPAVVTLEFSFNNLDPEWIPYTYWHLVNTHSPNISAKMGVPMQRVVRQNSMMGWGLVPHVPREEAPRQRFIHLSGIDGMESGVNIVHGRLPAAYLVDGKIIEAIITQQSMLRNNLFYNELLELSNVREGAGGVQQLFVKIVGIYELAEGSEELWTLSDIDHYERSIIVSNDLILQQFIPNMHRDFRMISTWFHLLDHSAMTSRRVPHYIETLETMQEYFHDVVGIRPINFTENFSEILAGHTAQTGPLNVTLWVLQVPIYVLLAFYIYMVSRQILQLEQNEISVLKSRGASRLQILGIYALQGLFMGLISFPAGIALGVFICHVLGASSGFLYLVQRAAIVVEITPDTLMFAGVAVLLSFLTMFLPVIRFSKVGIVDHKRNKAGKALKPLWQRFFLDILCLAVAIYALYDFNRRGNLAALAIQETQAVDPLLLLSSSLFIMGLGLLCLRLFPHIIKLVYTIGQRFWSPATYASLVKVMRSSGEEQFIMIFLLFTLSIGTFSAHAARTINLNSEHQIRYMAGADLTFRERWRWQGPSMHGPDPEAPPVDPRITRVIYFEPDFKRFANFEEVDALTPVQRQNVKITSLGPWMEVELMAIETDTFGETVWFRDDLLRAHINYFLNTLGSRADGVLLSDNFRTEMGLRIGDTIVFRSFYTDRHREHLYNSTRGVIVGFVDLWPGFSPVQRIEIYGQVVELYRSLIVANIGHIQSAWGMHPYHVWMRTNTDSNSFFHNFVAENRLHIVDFSDANAQIIESRSNPILQGTNGVLTVSFIVTLLVCFTGFLIYWILSLRSRVLQFGIFRAMGMSMRSLIGLLVNEQIFITLVAIMLGALVGEVSAHLFIPLIQMSYTAADQAIPLMIVTEARDYINLYSIVGFMIVVCLAVLGWYISKIKIAHALKLGED